MLKVHKIPTLIDKAKYLEEFQISSTADSLVSDSSTTEKPITWVVPDLKSKLELQKYYLKQQPALEEASILRATDLWQKVLDQCSPGWRVMDRVQTEILLLDWVEASDRTILKTTGSVAALLEYISRFLPVLTNPSVHELMLNWLEQNPRANKKWRIWYLLAKKYFHKFYQKKWCETQWVSGVLLDCFQNQNQEFSWPKTLVFDLSTQISVTEIECIKCMSEFVDIHILMPYPERHEKYWEVLYPYTALEDQLSLQEKSDEKPEVKLKDMVLTSKLRFERYPTMLAEVKGAISQISKWKSEGIKNSEIAIVAPNIEVYWPVLRRYLDFEKVPYQKDVVYRVHSHPKWLQWRAKMKMTLKSFDFSELEFAEYYDADETKMKYGEFKNLFNLLFDSSDLKRSRWMADRYNKIKNSEYKIGRDDFIEWALSFVDNFDEESEYSESVLLQPIQNIVTRCPRNQSLTLSNWLRLFESYSIFENIKTPADFDGVHCLNLATCEFVPAKKWIALGVCDRELSVSSQTSIYTLDVVQIYQDLGFHLNVSPYWTLELSLEWLASLADAEILYMAPATDFAGETLGASPFWLEGAIQSGVELDTVLINNDSSWDRRQKELKEVKVEIDSKSVDSVKPVNSQLSFSATRLNHFFQCPFIYYSEKLLKLNDLPDLDMDVDPLTKGTMTHSFFEQLTEEPIDFDCDEKKMDSILEDCRKSDHYVFADERLWEQSKSFYKKLGSQFLRFEKEWRLRFPETKTVGREVQFEGYWDRDLKKMSKQGDIVFRGAVDRIDTDGHGHYTVIDYKSTGSAAKNFGSWLENGVFQLALYSQALSESLMNFEPGNVVGAYFFNVKDMKRNLGFTLSDVENGLVEVEPRSRSKITEEERERLFLSINEEINKIVEQALEGGFEPKPRELEQCNGCSWRTLCRAPHLQ